MNVKIPIALIFSLLFLSLPIFSKNIYIKYDPTCLDRYEYRLNGNTLGNGYIAYYLEGANGQKIMLEVGVESIKQVKVAPKGTQSCKWLNVNEKFANEVNNGVHKVYVVRKINNQYTVSPVHLATYIQKRNQGLYASGRGFNFEYQQIANGYIPNDLAGMSSDSKFMYLSSGNYDCMNSYRVKRIPIETCKPTTDLVIIPGIGIVTESTDVAPFSSEQNVLQLEKINGILLNEYINQVCNPRVAEVITYEPPPPPPPVSYEIVYEEVPVEYQPVGSEVIFTQKSPPPVAEVFVPAVTCANASRPGIHVVQRQESLFGIARVYGLNVSELRSWNKLGADAVLRPCQELKVTPPKSEAEILVYKRPEIKCPQASFPGYHVVQPQETLQGIATQYGISVANILKWNDLERADMVKACEPIRVQAPRIECAEQSRKGVHIVQSGETLTDISTRYFIEIADLRKWNNLSSTDVLQACTALIVEAPAPVPQVVEKTIIKCSEQSRKGIHIVQPGETLNDISKRYFVAVETIRAWNDLKKKDVLQACTALIMEAPQPAEKVIERTIIKCSEQSRKGVHIVQPGETLTDISNRYFISIDHIRAWNNLKKTDVLQACTALIVEAPKVPEKVIEKTIIRCSEQSRKGVHIVQPGETLTDIANRYYISIDNIRAWNSIKKNEVLKACAALVVEAPAQAPQVVEKTIIRCSEQSRKGVHIVQPGETLTDISTRYFLSIESLRAWNNIKKNDVIKACTALIVEAPAQAPQVVEKTIIRCSEQSRRGVHIVQPGETLTDISTRYFLSIESLRAWNSLKKNEILKACTALIVEAPAPAEKVIERTVIRCSEQSRRGVHIVQPGETLTDIANRYYLSVENIQAWNGLKKGDLIKACTALKVEAPAPQERVVEKTVIRCSEQSRPGVHIVQPKQTLREISERYFVTIEELKKWNKIGNDDIIKACTALKVTAPVIRCDQSSYPGVHIVQPRETLTDIARRYAVGIQQLRSWNNLKLNDKIKMCAAIKVSPPRVRCEELSRPGVHIVQPKENITMIANQYSITIDEIRKWNKLDPADIIIACTPLRVVPPTPTNFSSLGCKETSYPGVHIVQPKENITMISERYGISLAQLRLWNNLGPKDLIYPCTRFKVAPPRKAPTGAITRSDGTYKIIPGVSYTNSKDDLTTKGGSAGIVAGVCFHTVRSGETLTAIALLYGYTTEEFRTINSLRNADLIRVGQRLKTAANCPTEDIPALEVTGTPIPFDNVTPRANRTVHVVKDGDTLGGIANKYKVTVATLLQLNNLERGEVIFPMMRLYIN